MKEVGIGVIGLGWGQLQVEAFSRVSNARVVAVCDADAVRTESVAKNFNISKKYADFIGLIQDPDVRLVSVAVPPESHKLIVCAAIEAGKHVLCEKPLGQSVNDARELLRSAESRKVVHAIDFEMRYLPALAYAKELIDEDYLGQLLRVDVTMGMERPWGEHGNWAADDARGGGVLREVGSHFIDALVWMFGEVKEVFSQLRTNYPAVRIPTLTTTLPLKGEGEFVTREVTGDDAFWCAMRFERGGEALLNFVTGARHDPGWSISAYGKQGALVIKSGYLSGARVGDKEMEVLGIPKRLELPDKPRDPLMWSMARMFERVAAKISGEHETSPFPTFRDGVGVARIVEGIRRASDEKVWVSVS